MKITYPTTAVRLKEMSMTITVKNLHPKLTIQTERRNSQQAHKDNFDHWRSLLLRTLNKRSGDKLAINIDDDDVVCIYENGALIHEHHLMYSATEVNTVYGNFNLMQKNKAFTAIILADTDQPLKADILNFIFKPDVAGTWKARVESKVTSVTVQF
ncbi:MAG: hypothetical protein ACI8QY_000827 [bacterium]|jgi:hypothetical protein